MSAQIQSPSASGVPLSENGILAQRPYVASEGRYAGQSVISVNTGQLDKQGQPVYSERPINANASLRKDEWINLEDTIIEAARERLVIVEDLRAAGLTYNVGGLGTIISEWESGSEITDASVSMDGESSSDKDRQDFDLHGVPIPVIHKEFKIGERMLLASRQRGAGLDVTTGTEAGRAVARVSESIAFNGSGVGASDGRRIYGLTNFPDRATFTISDWSDDDATTGISPEGIHAEILQMVQKQETENRHFGPFVLYIPAEYAFRFRQDFKEFSDKTLMERVTDEDVIANVRISDKLAAGNVVLIEMTRSVIDLAVASDITTIQWASGSGWTNQFQVFAAWAPRLKRDFDGRCGILHGSTA